MRDVLRGVKVLEIAQWWFAPSAAALLAEWGAQVVKVEHPEHGDAIRGLSTAGVMPASLDFNFMLEQCNHGKRSIGLDIGASEGRPVLDRLIEQSDVLITNYLPAVRRRLRIDVEDARAVNPRIIYARAHGAGARGPERERAGFDSTSFWARGGVVHHLTPPDADGPIPPRPSFGDGISGLSLAGAVAAALFGLERHGEPSVIDVSLLGTAAWVMGPDVVAAGAMPGGLPAASRSGMGNPLSNCYRTADGRWIWFAMLQADRHWPEFCEQIGRPDLLTDERFASGSARAGHLPECMAELEKTFAGRSLAEWREKLAGLHGAWAVVQDATDVLHDPQVVANDYVAQVQYDGSTHALVRGPAQFDEEPAELTRAPGPGEHTDQILLELGYGWDELVELKIAGAVN